MDRQLSDLEPRTGDDERFSSAIPLHGDAGYLPPEPVAQRVPNDTPAPLRTLRELETRYDPATRTLHTWIRPAGRPSFTPPLLADFEGWQDGIAQAFGPGRLPLDFLVLGSRAPGVWCLGGDLDLFQGLIRAGDRAGLAAYGHRCVAILHKNYMALDLPLLTVGLVQGQALGGGLEALLSFDFVIAERGTTFGLPEVMFGLFPGMGAHAFLARRLGSAQAERVILGNRTYTAEEFYEMGLITQLAAPGEGEAELRAFIARSARRHAGLLGARKAMRRAQPLDLAELDDIVDLWAEAALALSESDLRMMSRLVSAQNRKVG
jgi:DSF synthase